MPDICKDEQYLITNEYALKRHGKKICLSIQDATTGLTPKTYLVDDSSSIAHMLNNYQIKYNRLYDRVFDNRKAEKICRGYSLKYAPTQYGIRNCLNEFITGQRNFHKISWK